MGSVAADHGNRGPEKDFHIEPERLIADVAQIHANHFVKRSTAAAMHLPDAGDAGLTFEDSPSVPQGVVLEFISDGRPWSDKRHLAAQDVDELRQLIEAALAEEVSERRNARIISHLESALAAIQLFCDQTPDVFLVNRRVVIGVHGPEFQEGELLPKLTNAFLAKQHRSPRGQFDHESDRDEQWPQAGECREAEGYVERPFDNGR